MGQQQENHSKRTTYGCSQCWKACFTGQSRLVNVDPMGYSEQPCNKQYERVLTGSQLMIPINVRMMLSDRCFMSDTANTFQGHSQRTIARFAKQSCGHPWTNSDQVRNPLVN